MFFLTFMSIYLLGNVEFVQLLRLPMIFIHYKNHLADNEKLDFVYFLSSHYDELGDGNVSDNQEENQMPFMQVNNHITTICFVSFLKLKIASPLLKISKTNYSTFTLPYIPDVYSHSLLRPPIISS
jgi:hypothetical protein